jgi:hypothetical protein
MREPGKERGRVRRSRGGARSGAGTGPEAAHERWVWFWNPAAMDRNRDARG